VRSIVCVKRVPETPTFEIVPPRDIRFREGTNFAMNAFDEFAVEEALQQKDKHGGEVIALSLGPPENEKILKDCLAMGATGAFRIWDPAFAGGDPFTTADLLALAIRKLGEFDFVFCGREAIDGQSGLVGPLLARALGATPILYLAKIREIDLAARSVVVERQLEGGREVVRAKLPAVLCCTKDINHPRYPSLLGIRKAAKIEVPVWGAAELGADVARVGAAGARLRVTEIAPPPSRTGGEVLQGDADAVTDALVERILGLKVL
jgi:electron transfer flavoprotein beta subunit